jgi:hypothetical protein
LINRRRTTATRLTQMHYKSTQLELSHEGISDYRGNQLVTKNGKIQHVLIIFSVKKSPNGKVNPPIGSLCAMSLSDGPSLRKNVCLHECRICVNQCIGCVRVRSRVCSCLRPTQSDMMEKPSRESIKLGGDHSLKYLLSLIRYFVVCCAAVRVGIGFSTHL